MTPQEFSTKIKTKYPQYKDMDDIELAQKIVTKYPQYASSVKFDVPTEDTGVMRGTQKVLGGILGGEKIGEVIGTQIAKGTFGDTVQKLVTGKDLTPEEEALVSSGPSMKEVGGDILKTASTFLPVGKIASLVGKGARAIGIGGKVADVGGKIVAGGVTGAISDVGTTMAGGEDASLGLGTAIGMGIPATSPIIGAIARATAKVGARGASEITGALTGTSAETLEQAFNASRRGGDDAVKFTEALRGKTTPEKLVNTFRQNVEAVSSQRQALFKQTLDELGDIRVSTTPAKEIFKKNLAEAGISINENNTLNFANNKLRTVPNAQKKLVQAWDEINKMPESLTLSEIDTTRQAVKGIKAIAGDEPSSNLANMLIDDAVRATRKAGEQVDGYGQMLDNFGETSEFLDEVQKGLASGDRATVDQTFRRMATALKTNNEQRMALVRELDEMTGGSTLSEVSGQQLSEVLPRGIFRQIAAGIAGGAVVTGGLSSSMIPALVFASPRVAGEVVRALGLSAGKTDAILSAIGDAQSLLIKAGVLGGSFQERGDLENTVNKK